VLSEQKQKNRNDRLVSRSGIWFATQSQQSDVASFSLPAMWFIPFSGDRGGDPDSGAIEF
jgi:hypothetical protein